MKIKSHWKRTWANENHEKSNIGKSVGNQSSGWIEEKEADRPPKIEKNKQTKKTIKPV